MPSDFPSSEQQPAPVEIPWLELSATALRGVIEAYVLREGTEYGERDHSLDEKVSAVIEQLERGDARILYYAEPPTVELVLTHELKRRAAAKDPDHGGPAGRTVPDR